MKTAYRPREPSIRMEAWAGSHTPGSGSVPSSGWSAARNLPSNGAPLTEPFATATSPVDTVKVPEPARLTAGFGAAWAEVTGARTRAVARPVVTRAARLFIVGL